MLRSRFHEQRRATSALEVSEFLRAIRFHGFYVDRFRSLFDGNTHKNQSTATIIEMSSVGRPTAVNTSNMVTRPADGTDAAPMKRLLLSS